MTWYRYESDVLILKLYIQPGARRHEIIGPMQDELKIKLASPPLEGRANAALIKWLAELFKVPRSNILLKSGEKSRHKTVHVFNSTLLPESIFG